MKKLLYLLLLFSNICLGQVSDTFNYTGFLTDNGWVAHNGTVVTPPATYIKQITTSTNSLNYNGICTQGNRISIVSGNTEDVNLSSPTDLTGTIYYSMIINITSTGSLSSNATNLLDNTNFIHLCDTKGVSATGFRARLCIRKGTITNTFNLGIISEGSTGDSPIWMSTNYNTGTYFIVVKYNFNSSSALASLWVNSLIENTPLVTDNRIETTRPTKIQSIAIRQASGTGDIEIDEIRLGSTWEYVTNQTTWTSSWTNGTPNQYKRVVIDGTYNTSTNGNIDACSITVNSGKTLTINNNQYANIQNELTNNGTINITDGSLVQSNNTANTGNITYNRTTTSLLRGYDYVYWSSPVNNQILSDLYTTPTMGFKYEWDPDYPNSNSTQGNWITPTTTMTNGKGYIIRASSSYEWGPAALTGIFYGVPNNGNYSSTIQRGNLLGLDDNWNLVGNPYPSSIKITSFLTTNTNIDGYVYLWKHSNEPTSTISPFYQNFQYNYYNDYLTVNGMGSNDATNPNYIAAGQGFFVSMTETPISYASLSGNVNFTNLMRDKTYDNSIFYKQTNTKSRVWLDLLDVNNNPNRILVGYTNEATNGKDRMYDAITTTGTTTKIYSLIDNDPYIIQGRSKFKNNDQVKLGINITSYGEYKIAIAEVDGLFQTQDIYLEDKLLNITHDLKSNPYIFISNVGLFNDRFILKYKNNNGNHFGNKISNIVIYKDIESVKIKSDEKIKNIKVYNLLGQILYEGDINSNELSIDINSNQILVFKITTDNGITTKKFVK